MTAADKIAELEIQIEQIKEKYCYYCMEGDCSYCWARLEEDEDYEDR